MAASRADVASIATILLESGEPGELLAAVEAYFQYCGEIVGAPSPNATQLREGVAISPEDTARCTLDVLRTATFVRGVRTALDALHQQLPARRLRVLYAGCGPFAPLGILPIVSSDAASSSGSAQEDWLFVDVHASALVQARRLVEHWQLTEARTSFLCADASRLPVREWAPDLVIVEVMQRSLAKEPQLAVTAALTELLAPEGILIPTAVEVHLALARLSTEFDLTGARTPVSRPRVRKGLGRLLRVDRENAAELYARATSEGGLDLGRRVVGRLEEADMTPILRTSIEVFAEHYLGDYDSGLTVPEVLRGLTPVRGGDTFVAHYEMGPLPRLRVERTSGSGPEDAPSDPSLGMPPHLG